MFRATKSAVLAAVSLAALSLAPSASQACFLCNWFGQSSTANRPVTARYAAYYPATTCCSPPQQVCQQVCQYVPQTCYRAECVNVPVTTYHPITTCDPCTGCSQTCWRPATTYARQVRYVPYTTYRPVTTTVCSGTTTYYAPNCSTGACAGGACAGSACAGGNCSPAGTILSGNGLGGSMATPILQPNEGYGGTYGGANANSAFRPFESSPPPGTPEQSVKKLDGSITPIKPADDAKAKQGLAPPQNYRVEGKTASAKPVSRRDWAATPVSWPAPVMTTSLKVETKNPSAGGWVRSRD